VHITFFSHIQCAFLNCHVSIALMASTYSDTTPSSLLDSTMSPKVKTMEGERVGVHSLVNNTSGVEGCAGALGWDLDEQQAVQLFTRTCTNQTTSWLV